MTKEEDFKLLIASLDIYNGDMVFKNHTTSHIPPIGSTVIGDVFIAGNNIKTLDGCPIVVNGDFHCINNKLLYTLKGGPMRISGECVIENSSLTSLRHAPVEVGSFQCTFNKIRTLLGGPSIVNGDYLVDNNNLIDLKGAPVIVNGDFNCSNNPLCSIKHLPKVITGSLICFNTKKQFTIEQIKAICKIHGNIILTRREYFNIDDLK